MASTSAGKYISDSEKEFETEVFLSFRGTDTRDFVDHLFDGLKTTRFKAFLDNDGLEHGKDIQQKLYEAIRRSKMSVVILSTNYADSRWCLDELVEIMELHSLNVHDVLPVFFDVQPTVVRNQKDVYKNAFSKLEERYKGEKERVEKWKSALKRVADLKGLSKSADCSNSLLVKTIIQVLEKIFSTRRLDVPQYIVGRKEILEDISKWLQDGSSDVEVGLIYGLGGIGKSTIAKIAYNSNYRTFDSSSFLEDFTRKTSQSNGIACILEEVISDVTGKPANKIYSEGKGILEVKSLLGCRRVLMVFDDVHELKNLPDAFNDPKIFGNGSKIIITTRTRELRKVPLLKREFRVSELDRDDSKELLKVHASNKNPLSQRQEELLDEFLPHCKGFPQALYVMGPVLRDETEETWKSKLEELEEYKDPELLSVFKLSYESLGDKSTKDLFLYIACFFIGMDKEYSLKILKGCKLQRPMTGLQNLVDRCLLTIDYHGKLMMHQSIEEMGKEIVHLEDTTNPGRRRILWSTKDSTSVLQNNEGTSIIRGLRLYLPKPDNPTSSEPHKFKILAKRICLGLNFWNPRRDASTSNLELIKTSSFTKMSDLELLLLTHVQLEGDFEDFPKKIKWLLWLGCPLQSIPSNFYLNELVVLDMQKSCLVCAWEAGKYQLGALRILNLSYSVCLLCTPDLSCALRLEFLYLDGCISLGEVHKSIGDLINLSHLSLEGCTRLLNMHRSIGTLRNLRILNLKGCNRLMSFPIPTSVEQLNLEGCSSFLMASNQMESSFLWPVASTSPISRSNLDLHALKVLNLAGCGISQDNILELLSCAPSLELLDLGDNPIFMLNNTRDHLKYLNHLVLRDCTTLCSISNLPRSCWVDAENCCSLATISYNDGSDPVSTLINAPGCFDLVEVIYGCNNDRLEIIWIDELDESEASQIGFPDLAGIKDDKDFDFDFDVGKGLYRAGVFQVYVGGEHLAKWFIETETVTELLYLVPGNQLDIRALNLGFMVSPPDNMKLELYSVTIKNLTSKWEWTLWTPYEPWYMDSCKVTFTWLSHWRTVEEHREIKPGDELQISARASCGYDIIKWGIKFLYEDQQQVDEDGSEQDDDDDDDDDDYSNIFLFPLDLSVYESKSQTNQNQKSRKYNIPYDLQDVWPVWMDDQLESSSQRNPNIVSNY